MTETRYRENNETFVCYRFNKFLLFLGVPPCDIHKTKPAEFLKVIAEFSLEYRTTRERVLQQLEKKANHRERNKTRGKMIIDVSRSPDTTVQASYDGCGVAKIGTNLVFIERHFDCVIQYIDIA